MSTWITGVGAVTAAGPRADSLAGALAQGRCCLEPSESLDGRWVGRVQGDDATPSQDRLDPSGRLFVRAAREAWTHAGLDDQAPADPEAVALVEGTSIGPIGGVIDAVRGAAELRRPTNLIRYMPGGGGSAFSIERRIEGAVLLVSAGSASSAFAIGQAHQMIERGEADVVVAGGADAPLQPDIVASFARARILAPPGELCRPLDGARQGPVLGEGAGVLVLESERHARARGATPLGSVQGFGWSTEACSPTRPHPEGKGVGRAAAKALRAAHCGEPSWIALHGSGTTVNDRAECVSLRSVLGHGFARTPVTALKATVGHCLGASPALEAVGALLAMADGFVPEITTLRTLDPALPRCDPVGEVRSLHADSLLLLSESFGGRCAALVLGA